MEITTQDNNEERNRRCLKSETRGRRTKLLLLLVLSLLVVGCNFPVREDDILIDPDPTTPPTSVHGSISGVIWHDLCDSSSASKGRSEGCVKAASQSFYHANGILDVGEPGIEGIELTLGQGVCPAKGLEVVHSGSKGEYRFTDLEGGVYCVSVSNAAPHLAKLEPGMWTYPKADGGQGVGWISVSVFEGNSIPNINFGWDFLLQLQKDPASIVTPTPEPVCTDHVTFVKDVTISDWTSVEIGESFQKVWRLKNTGTCIWTPGYSLVFHIGELKGQMDQVSLSQEVLPGEAIDVLIELVAPQSGGRYESYWMLQNSKGEKFGIGDSGDRPFWVKINAGVTPSPTAVVSWTPRLDPGDMEGEGRWVDVDLGDQLLTAYEGSNPVMTFLVSTGTAAHPTVTGQFRIWTKLESTRMRGPGYDLEDVPYTMYFYEGYGLHGAYWHNNFGTPMSHGCVNLSPSEAGWLFNFASVGTLVNIHS